MVRCAAVDLLMDTNRQLALDRMQNDQKLAPLLRNLVAASAPASGNGGGVPAASAPTV